MDRKKKKGENTPMLSVIIPTLDAAATLPAALAALPENAGERIVADGGSSDGTARIAAELGASVVESECGRGIQLHRGAAAACGGWLLFLHADTRLSREAAEVIENFIGTGGNARRAGYFRFKLDDRDNKARFLERCVSWRCKIFALPYGDQGFLIGRSFYNELGGYRKIPLMEDVDLVWRIHREHGRKALAALEADAVTSAEKFRRSGYLRRSARNLFCLFLFRLKVPPHLIAKLY